MLALVPGFELGVSGLVLLVALLLSMAVWTSGHSRYSISRCALLHSWTPQQPPEYLTDQTEYPFPLPILATNDARLSSTCLSLLDYLGSLFPLAVEFFFELLCFDSITCLLVYPLVGGFGYSHRIVGIRKREGSVRFRWLKLDRRRGELWGS